MGLNPVSDAPIADDSWGGRSSLKLGHKDRALGLFKLMRYSLDKESKKLSIEGRSAQIGKGYRYGDTLHSVIAHLLKAVLKGRGFKSIFFL